MAYNETNYEVDKQIIYEDNHLLIINKQTGQLVQPDDLNEEEALEENIKAYIAKKYNKPGKVFLGVIHRLDRPVSGVCAFARTSKMLERMNTLFSTREVEKTYLAIVNNKPPKDEDTLVHWLEKDRDRNIARAHASDKKGLRSELSYKLLGGMAGTFLLEVKPKTGRPHQIRAQLAYINCAIIGDIKYGSTRKLRDRSIALHAIQLQFEHPVQKKPFSVAAYPPDTEWWREFKQIYTEYVTREKKKTVR